MKRRGSARSRADNRDSASRTAAWISIRVDLIEGRGEHLWPRPGRLFAASSNHTFDLLAAAINDAFARWDRSHLHEFELKDGTRLGIADPDDAARLDGRRLNLSRLKLGDQFIYVFDFGDDWAHLCMVDKSPIDPIETLGTVPGEPVPYFGWGGIPDQYGRVWNDDSDTQIPTDPELSDLPPLRPGWGGRG